MKERQPSQTGGVVSTSYCTVLFKEKGDNMTEEKGDNMTEK